MIEVLKQPYKEEEVKKILNPIVNKWFFSKFKEFSLPQLYGVKEIHDGNNILVSAPTGATKTLTAFLSILNELINLSEKNKLENKVYCIYISPLKALSRDLDLNLKKPLQEMETIANKKLGIRVTVRTGDTTAAEKQKMLKEPPHILIITPESLALILSSIKFKEFVRDVKWVIVDEIHALANNKRGVHLSLSLERLQQLNDFIRIGLSATISPLEEVAKFLVGYEEGKVRNCKIVDVQFIKDVDLKVISPLPDLINTTHNQIHNAMYNLIDKLVQEHKTTLIFTNTRSATERVVDHLKNKFPKKYIDNIGAHHGSLSREHRIDLENKLKEGKLKCVVCSTSLELGIDIGYIDLVICLGSPKSIARFLQRSGRAGHKFHDKVKARIIVLDRDDLVECSVLLKSAIERKIDKIDIPKNCLDVLAQQIHGVAVSDRIYINDLFRLVKSSYCYKELSKEDFLEVINYLSGKYVDLEDRNIYAKIWYDEESGLIGRKGKLSRVIYMTNIGTIPEESFITVKINEQAIGHIDEAFLERLKPGDVFVLGGNTYEFQFSRGMTAQVKASSYRPPTVPSWFSEQLPLSFDLAFDINRFRKLMEEKFNAKKNKEEIIKFINEYLYVDENAANAIYEYFKEQYLYAEISHDKKLLVEFFNLNNKKYVVFHSLYGRRVNDALSRAIAFVIARLQHRDVEIGINDNGFFIATDDKIQVLRAFNLIRSNELRKIVSLAIDKSEVLKRRFRHCATRALMILRQYKGKKKRIGRQQVSSMILMNALRRISDNFCILKESKREVMEDLMDVDNAANVLRVLEEGKMELKQIATSLPSPFAFNIVLQGHLDVLKMEDRMEFLKRMHNMVLTKIELKK
ncbi:MAG: ATP-dependent helicase [Nanoarchaeota archaeon]